MKAEEVINFALWLKRTKRSSDATIEGKLQCLNNLKKRVNLWDTQAVENVIREAEWKHGYKNRVVYAYADWLHFHGFDKYKPKPYYVNQKLPYVPLEKDIDQLIAGLAGSKLPRFAALVQLGKESGW